MNKKLLFGIMSLSALAACTNDDFEGKNGAQLSEQVSPIQFEVINNAEVMRAKMDGNTIQWSARDNDLFTLYHGGLSQNATYKASEGEGGAVLTTPSVIQPGEAVMVWPADTAFNNVESKAGFYKVEGTIAVKIPEVLTNVENNIPYASDLLTIEPYAPYSETAEAPAIPTAYKTAGKDRKYAVYMRPMASQLILKADYAGTDAVINELTKGSDPIDPIALTSVEINDPASKLTKQIQLQFTDPTDDPKQGTHANWNTVANNVWTQVTGFNRTTAVGAAKLTTKCINGIESAKFLMLPTKENIGADGLEGANIVVNTIYGKVTIVKGDDDDPTKYTATEIADAWYRYAAQGTTETYGEKKTNTAGTGSDASKVRYTNNIEKGLAQVIDAFSKNTTTKATSVVVNEPTGAVGTRYVKVLLTKLDMNGLHVKTDKQLYDAVRVWKEIGKGNVIVNLDGDAKTGEFEISQKTIAKINEINAELAETKRTFEVRPCKGVTGEACTTIVITGGGDIQDMVFIKSNDGTKADVALNEGENWNWKGTVKLYAAGSQVNSIINRGTMNNGETATLNISNDAGKKFGNVPLVNDGTWNITAGAINVQFNVTNNGIVNIAKGAEYRQDAVGSEKTTFTNQAETVPERFYKNDPKKKDKDKFVEKIGVVNNSGVFAALAGRGEINNYGLIEHLEKNAKTYITANQTGAGFGSAFSATGTLNKMGRINLPFSNKDEDNISIDAAADQGFVSVTVTSDNAPEDKKLDASKVGEFVNYVIINSGIEEVTNVSAQVKYIEFNDKDNTEIAWMPLYDKDGKAVPYVYDGLVVFSPVNIKLNTTVQVKKSAFLAANIYVAGKLNNGAVTPAQPKWDGYFGETGDNAKEMYITFK